LFDPLDQPRGEVGGLGLLRALLAGYARELLSPPEADVRLPFQAGAVLTGGRPRGSAEADAESGHPLQQSTPRDQRARHRETPSLPRSRPVYRPGPRATTAMCSATAQVCGRDVDSLRWRPESDIGRVVPMLSEGCN